MSPIDGAFQRYRPLIDDWPAFVDALGEPLPTCVWANPLRISAAGLAERLAATGFRPRPLAWRPGAFRLEPGSGIGRRWEFLAGLCHIQEEASLLPVRLLAPQPGDRVLDLCAAPGGKTAELAFALNNRGTVIANEVNRGRIRALRGNLDRLGLINVSIVRHDGSGLPAAIGGFDKVLVDAPCSGSGTVRRKAGRDARVRPTSPRLAGLQVALLRRAVRLCRPGGSIVYSTCTFAPEENEAVVDVVLRQDGERFGLRLAPADLDRLPCSPGVTRWEGRDYDARLQHAVRLWPHLGNTGGFFAARIEKRDDPDPIEDGSPALERRPEREWRPVAARFGLEAALQTDWLVHRSSQRGLHAAAADHRPPVSPRPEATGIRLSSAGGAVPRLSTGAAMALGAAATRNVVELPLDCCERFLARETLELVAGQRIDCDEGGVAVVRNGRFGLGSGQLRAGGRRMESLVPKKWSGMTR